MTTLSPEERSQLAPTGTIRFAINTGNAGTTTIGADNSLGGPSVVLATRLAETVGLPLELIPFDSARRIVEAVSRKPAWDVAFLASDPARGHLVHFSAPYLRLEATYAVPQDSPLTTPEQVDQPGIRIASSMNAAYDLHLQRVLKKAERIAHSDPLASIVAFRGGGFNAVAGIRNTLQRELGAAPDVRLLDRPFLVVSHTMAVPAGRAQALLAIDRFLSRQPGTIEASDDTSL